MRPVQAVSSRPPAWTAARDAARDAVWRAARPLLDRAVAGAAELWFAWRDHLAVPRDRAELRRLLRDGPQPVSQNLIAARRFGLDDLLCSWPRERTGDGRYHAMVTLHDVRELSSPAAAALARAGLVSVGDVRRTPAEALGAIPGLDRAARAALRRI